VEGSLSLAIKASTYRTPTLIPAEVECGVIGCAVLAATTHGPFARLAHARLLDTTTKCIHERTRDRHDRMMRINDTLYAQAQQFYDDLDALDTPASAAQVRQG
jgi:xylulokinase